MAFHLLDNVVNFLFKGWTTHSALGFAGVCLVVALVTILAESIKVIRSYLSSLSNSNPLTRASSAEIKARPLLVQSLLIPPSLEHIRKRKIKIHVGQTALHVVEVVVGYLIMLAVMSYNGWVAITVVVASGAAYYLLGVFRSGPKSRAQRTDSNSVNNSDTGSTQVTPEEGGAAAVPTATNVPTGEEEDSRLVAADVHL